jgi:hypothetical protein
MNHLGRMLLLTVVVAILSVAAWVCLQWTSGSPEPDLWRQELGLDPLWLTWTDANAKNDGPARLVFRGVYAILLSLELSYDQLGWVTLCSALLAFLLLARWIYACIADRLGATTRTAILLVVCAAMFSPSYGANWLLAERFRMFVPIACLAAGGLLLRQGRWLPLRYVAALLFAQIALLTDVRGLWVWVALLPCCAAIAEGQRRAAYLAGWVIAGNVGALASEFSMGPSAPSDASWIVTTIVADPFNYLLEVVTTLGRSLPDLWHGTTTDETVIGAGMLLLFVLTSSLALRRLEVAMAAWWAMAAFGLGAALTSTAQLHGIDIDRITRHELEWSILSLPIGLGGLVAELGGGRLGQWLRAFIPAIFVLLVQDWQHGFTDLTWRHAQLREYEARLAFYEATELDPDKIGPRAFGKGWQRKAARMQGLLDHAQPLDDFLSKLQSAAAAQPHPSSGVILKAHDQTISGHVADTAEMVWVAKHSKEQGWQLIQAIPLQPSEQNDTHSWTFQLEEASMPIDKTRLAVFAFDLDSRSFIRLAGNVLVNNRSFQNEVPK